MARRTRGWWLIRIEFAIAIAIGCLLLLLAGGNSLMQPMFGADRVEFFGLPSLALVILIGAIGWIVGLAWMIRIARGPTDDVSVWRYRDR